MTLRASPQFGGCLYLDSDWPQRTGFSTLSNNNFGVIYVIYIFTNIVNCHDNSTFEHHKFERDCQPYLPPTLTLASRSNLPYTFFGLEVFHHTKSNRLPHSTPARQPASFPYGGSHFKGMDCRIKALLALVTISKNKLPWARGLRSIFNSSNLFYRSSIIEI